MRDGKIGAVSLVLLSLFITLTAASALKQENAPEQRRTPRVQVVISTDPSTANDVPVASGLQSEPHLPSKGRRPGKGSQPTNSSEPPSTKLVSAGTLADPSNPRGPLAGGSSSTFSGGSLLKVKPPRDPLPAAYLPHPGLLGNPEVRPEGVPRPRPLRVALTRAERELLAHLIYAEAAGEPYEGKVAVAAVILNRLESPDFPNTVEGVVFERMAFEPVTNGRLWMSTSALAYRALEDALRGHDPTHGAVYFYNPRLVRPDNWIRSRRVIQVIGQHHFAI